MKIMANEGAKLRKVMKIILDEEYDDTDMYLTEIKQKFNRRQHLKLKMFESHPLLFEISQDRKGHVVTLIASTKICPDHVTPAGCPYSNCWMFHICKYYILSKSCFHKSCRFGHSLKSKHNKKLLRLMYLDHPDITTNQLRILFRRLSNRTRGSVPVPCYHYNLKQSCERDDACNYLHICKYLLMGGCRYGAECNMNHSVTSENVNFLLHRYGITDRIEDSADDDDDDDEHDDDDDEDEVDYDEEYGGDDEEDDDDEDDNDDDESDDDDTDDTDDSDDDEEDSVIRDLIKIYIDNNITLESLRAECFKETNLIINPEPSCASQDEDEDSVHNILSTSTLLIQKQPEYNICIFYLRGSCRFNDRCRNLHLESTYQWQWIPDTSCDEWENLPQETNDEFEKCYCNLQELISFMSPDTGNTYSIDLDYLEQNDVIFRRLTTVDLTPRTSLFSKPWATKWIWYWLDNDGKWIEYGEKGSIGHVATITSLDIEVAYQENVNGGYSFTSQDTERRIEEDQMYILDFDKMKQMNVTYKTLRKIKRRPEFADDSLIQKRKVECDRRKRSEKLNIPSNWNHSPRDDIYAHYQVVELSPASEEYISIKESIVGDSSVVRDISSIKRIENVELWTALCVEKALMDRKLKIDVPIKTLYHGTENSIIEAICRQGFDSRLSGRRVGHLYGKGGYFGINSDLSCNYCDDNNLMFIVKALVGDYTLGSEDYLRPPLKNLDDPSSALYDACVDDMDSPSMFVLFNNRQVYPEYLVRFIRDKNIPNFLSEKDM